MYIGLTDAIQQRRLGINIFHGEQYWQGFVSYSIAVAKLFLNSIYPDCNYFIQLESITTLKVISGCGQQYFSLSWW